jgi:hypothetical protein
MMKLVHLLGSLLLVNFIDCLISKRAQFYRFAFKMILNRNEFYWLFQKDDNTFEKYPNKDVGNQLINLIASLSVSGQRKCLKQCNLLANCYLTRLNQSSGVCQLYTYLAVYALTASNSNIQVYVKTKSAP